ncbi:holin [Streptosporangium sp. NPDC002721]|uniref:holin n=1 Tax=Streptosporangium sp. NPDC002721 TaxID=3366188 RepID=UPI0036BF8FFF
MAGADHIGRHRRSGKGGIWSRVWWRDALERAVRAGAAAAVTGIGADQVGAVQMSTLRAVPLLAGGGALLSLLLSLAAAGTGDTESASFTES